MKRVVAIFDQDNSGEIDFKVYFNERNFHEKDCRSEKNGKL